MEGEAKKIKEVEILGVPFYAMTQQEAMTIFEALLLAGHQYQIAKANPEFVMTAQEDPEDMEILKKTVFNTADGIGILWAATFLAMPGKGYLGTLLELLSSGVSIVFNPGSLTKVLPARIGGVEYDVEVARTAAKRGVGIYLMGGSDAARMGAKAHLEKVVPGVTISGHAGSFQPIEEAEKLIQAVNESGAAVLIVCFGHPLQEKWIYANLRKMPNVRVAFGAGGSFDYLAGIQKRAPIWMRKVGLEWLWRMFTQRGRGEKMKKSLPRFIGAVFQSKLLKAKLEKRINTK